VPLGGERAQQRFRPAVRPAISRTAYATLFSSVGTLYGSGDGSTTFNIPDLRGRAVFGLDNTGGSPAGRVTGAGGNWDGRIRGNTGGFENRTLTQAQFAEHRAGVLGKCACLVSRPEQHNPQNSKHQHQHQRRWRPYPMDQTAVISSQVTVTPDGTVTAGGSTNLGSGNSFPTMPPAVSLMKILRVI
jgi:microcystin-dependent protein